MRERREDISTVFHKFSRDFKQLSNVMLRMSRMRMLRLPASEERRGTFVTLRRAVFSAVLRNGIQI